MANVIDLALHSCGGAGGPGTVQRLPPTTPLFAMASDDVDAVHADGAAAPTITETQLISVDLGHESMKVSAWRSLQPHISDGEVAAAARSTGSVSMVLNDQTNRKSAPCVSFRYFRDPQVAVGASSSTNSARPDELGAGAPPHTPSRRHSALYPFGYQVERTFAEQALALAPRFPTQVVCSAPQLLGYVASPTNVPATEASPHSLTPDQLTRAYGYHVVPLTESLPAGTSTTNELGEVQQQHDDVIVDRHALGVYVPFLTASHTAGQSPQRDAGNISISTTEKGVLFSSEEITAMLLGYARRMAEKADAVDNALSEEEQQLVKKEYKSGRGNDRRDAEVAGADTRAATSATQYVALTVPIHATIAQRQALVDAAAISGLRAVRLVHSTTSAAVQLAYTKAEQVLRTDKTQHVMIYDMGSQQTEVGVYRFAALTATMASRMKAQGTIELQALVGSRTLGGAAFDACIARHWDAQYFRGRLMQEVAAPAGTSEAEHHVAAKERGNILRAAQRAKEMLSANQEALITIDGVPADPSHFNAAGERELQQRRVTVTGKGGVLSVRILRSDFEEWCRPLFDEAVALRDEAIAATHGVVANLSALDRFEVIGGGTRVPRLLHRLSEGYRNGVVDRTLNSDEAAVLGTTLLVVSSAPKALGIRGSQSLPRYRVREWLTSAVYVSAQVRTTVVAAGAEEEAAAAAAANVHLLFPDRNTTLPAERSVRIRIAAADVSSVKSVIATLFSGVEADSAYARSTHADAAPEVQSPAEAEALATAMGNCASCYVQTCTVEGVREAAEQLLTQHTRQQGSTERSHERPRLTGAEVVIEVVATVSGIPHCSVAYLRAEMEEAEAPNAMSPREKDNSSSSARHKREGGDDGNGDDNASALPETADNALEEKRRHQEEGEGEGEGGEATHTEANRSDENPDDAATRPVKMQAQVRVVALSLHVSRGTSTAGTETDRRHYNMNSAEMAYSHQRLQRLQAIDDERLRHSTLRNEIESVLLSIREYHPMWDIEDGHPELSQPSSLQAWKATASEVGEWLSDFGDTASVTALEKNLRRVLHVKAAIREMREGMKG